MIELTELSDDIVPYAKCSSDPQPGSYRMSVDASKIGVRPKGDVTGVLFSSDGRRWRARIRPDGSCDLFQL